MKTFYRQISLYWRIRRVPLVIAFTFTFLLPFQVAAELFRLSLQFVGKSIYDDFPTECNQAFPEKDCLRFLPPTRDDGSGTRVDCDPDTGLQLVYKHAHLRAVGKALTECAASVPWRQVHAYKVEPVPGCHADAEISGSTHCIQFAQLLYLNSLLGIYTDVVVEQNRLEGSADSAIFVRAQLQNRLPNAMIAEKEEIASYIYECLQGKLVDEDADACSRSE